MGSLTHDDAVKLLTNHDFSDFTIRCGNEATFHVHKVLIAAKSDFLAACINGPFREGIENELIVQETTPLVLASLVFYIYSGSYDLHAVAKIWPEIKSIKDASLENKMARKRKRSGAGDEVSGKGTQDPEDNGRTIITRHDRALEELRCHVRLYELSDRFMMPELKTIATNKVETELQRCCMDCGIPRDLHLHQNDIATILADVQLYTTSDDTELRPAVLSFCISNYGSFSEQVAGAVEKSIKATDPLYWDFGMRIATQLRKTHEVFMSDVKSKVEKRMPMPKVKLCFRVEKEGKWGRF